MPIRSPVSCMAMDARDRLQQALIFFRRRAYPQALRYCQEAVAEARARSDAETLVLGLGSLGNVQAVLGRHEEARACYEEVLTIQRRHARREAIGQTLANLGNLHKEQGDFTRARAYYLEALDALSNVSGREEDVAVGFVYGNLGQLERLTGSPERAIEWLRQAVALYKRVGDEDGLAVTWGQLGAAYEAVGDPREAEVCFTYATTHCITVGDEPGEADALRGLARLSEARHDLEAAVRCFERVVAIDQRCRLPLLTEDAERLSALRARWLEAAARARGGYETSS